MRAFDRLVEPRWRRALVAIGVALVLFACGTFAVLPNGADDDYAFMLALSNRFPSAGEGLDGICLFLNAGLCQAIFALNAAMPSINWFVVLEVGLSCIAFAACVYVAFGLPRREMGFVFIMGLTLLILHFCTCRNNFTDAAFMYTCAGGLLLLSRLSQDEPSAGALVGGIVLMALGFMWRSDMFLMCLPFFGITALWLAFFRDPNRARKPLRLVPFFVVLALCAGLYAFNQAAWDAPELQDWRAFNKARSALVDYPVKPYAEVSEELEELDVSENDYWMATHWMTEDPEFFTTEKLSAIAEVAAIHNSLGEVAKNSTIELATFFLEHRRLIVYLALVALAALACMRGGNRAFCICMLLGAVGVTWALIALGRFPNRVAYPLWMYPVACCMAASFTSVHAEGRHVAQSGRSIRKPLLECAYALGALYCAGLFAWYTVSHIDVRMVQATFDMDSFKPDDALVDYQEAHADTIWVYDAHSYKLFEKPYLLRALPTPDVLEHTVTLGGWTARSPFTEARNKVAGAENPIKSLVDGDDVVYVAYRLGNTEHVLAYLQEHYYPHATIDVQEVPRAKNTYACTFSKSA